MIDLEKGKYGLNNFIIIKNSDYVNCFINYENNIFICTNAISCYLKFKTHWNTIFELLSYQLIEGEKGEIQIKMLDKKKGNYFKINCKKLICNSMIISSTKGKFRNIY